MEELVANINIEDIAKLAKILDIDMEESMPDLSDPQIIQRLGSSFTNDCLEQLETQERAELESLIHAHSVPIWG